MSSSISRERIEEIRRSCDSGLFDLLPTSVVRDLLAALEDEMNPKPKESDWQKTVIAWADGYGGQQYPEAKWLFAIPNGAARNYKTATFLRGQGLRRGVPDLCLPVARHKKGTVTRWLGDAKFPFYAGLYIEMKRDAKSRLQPEQQSWMDYLNGAGYLAVVCRSASDAIECIIEYLEGRL